MVCQPRARVVPEYSQATWPASQPHSQPKDPDEGSVEDRTAETDTIADGDEKKTPTTTREIRTQKRHKKRADEEAVEEAKRRRGEGAVDAHTRKGRSRSISVHSSSTPPIQWIILSRLKRLNALTTHRRGHCRYVRRRVLYSFHFTVVHIVCTCVSRPSHSTRMSLL